MSRGGGRVGVACDVACDVAFGDGWGGTGRAIGVGDGVGDGGAARLFGCNNCVLDHGLVCIDHRHVVLSLLRQLLLRRTPEEAGQASGQGKAGGQGEGGGQGGGQAQPAPGGDLLGRLGGDGGLLQVASWFRCWDRAGCHSGENHLRGELGEASLDDLSLAPCPRLARQAALTWNIVLLIIGNVISVSKQFLSSAT